MEHGEIGEDIVQCNQDLSSGRAVVIPDVIVVGIGANGRSASFDDA